MIARVAQPKCGFSEACTRSSSSSKSGVLCCNRCSKAMYSTGGRVHLADFRQAENLQLLSVQLAGHTPTPCLIMRFTIANGGLAKFCSKWKDLNGVQTMIKTSEGFHVFIYRLWQVKDTNRFPNLSRKREKWSCYYSSMQIQQKGMQDHSPVGAVENSEFVKVTQKKPS